MISRPNYDSDAGGFEFLHPSFLPRLQKKPPPIHEWDAAQQWIEKRIADPDFTKERAAEFVAGASRSANSAEAVLGLLETVVSALQNYPDGVPAKGTPAWELCMLRPFEDWYHEHSLREWFRATKVADAKIHAIRRSVEFGRLSVAEMAAYYGRRPEPDLWKAVTTLVDPVKVAAAVAYSRS
jgi:hypothetical protein